MRRHLSTCKSNVTHPFYIQKQLVHERKMRVGALKEAIKLRGQCMTLQQKTATAYRKCHRRIKQRQTQDKMRGDLDIAAAGKWHRANPTKRMPQYLEWLQLKFVHMALKLAKSAPTEQGPRSPAMTDWIHG